MTLVREVIDGKTAQSGASIVEFLVIAPVLIILVAASMYLNGLLEDRHGMAIINRNLAMSGDSQVDQATSGRYEGVEGAASLAGYDETHMKRARHVQEGEQGIYDSASRVMAEVADTPGEALDAIKNSPMHIFTADKLTRSVVVLRKKLSDPFTRALVGFSSVYEGTAVDPHITMTEIGVARRDAGYLPNEYRFQALLGYFITNVLQTNRKHWGSPSQVEGGLNFAGIGAMIGLDMELPDGFPAQCMMRFDSNDYCVNLVPPLSFVSIEILAIVAGIINTVLDIFSEGGTYEARQAAKEAIKEGIKEGVEQMITEAIEQKVEEHFTEEFKKKFGDKLENVAKKSLDSVKNRLPDIKEQMHGVLQ